MIDFKVITGAFTNQPGYLSLLMPFRQVTAIRDRVDFEGNAYRNIIINIDSKDTERLVLMILKLKSSVDINIDRKTSFSRN